MSGPSASHRPAGSSRGACGQSTRFSDGSISPAWRSRRGPSSFRRFLQRVEDPAENTPEEGLVAACDEALRGFERSAEQAVSRIRAVAEARRKVAPGDWNDAALERIRHVLQRLNEARQVLDDDSLPAHEINGVRKGLKEEEQQAAGQLAVATRDVLGRLEAADLPVEVLARALDEVGLAQTLGHEAAAVSLERLRVMAALPWTARALERVDIEAAMAELEAPHAGRREVKARIRRFLATRRLTSTSWTVEGRGRTVRSCRRDPSAPVALRRLVVRSARSATRAPILCFAGPPGGGKTSLAKLIAGVLRRPAVTVALGGVWDESAIRGLPTTFRTPEPGRIVRALLEARVRNPVIILDEIDKVGGRTQNHGDPSAALLEVLDPAQNTRFRDVYLDIPFDVSEVVFIATANDLAGVPAPLRDRLEVIEAPGYTDEEKVDIVRQTLRREQLEVAGLIVTGFWTRTPTVGYREGAGGGGWRGTQPQAADGGRARRGDAGGDAAGSPSGREPAADVGTRRRDGCGDPGSGPGPYLRGGGSGNSRGGSAPSASSWRAVGSRPTTTPRSPSSPPTTRPRGSTRPAATSPWPRSWDHRGMTRCPTTYGMRSPGSETASWACIRPTPRPSPRRRGSR